ncbi:MAG: nitrate- and nitrite sensing domain-containing protein [Magnetococcus sp. YQC-9]
MNVFTNLKLNTRFLAMVILPLTGLIFFGAIGVWEKFALSRDMTRMEQLSGLAVRASALIHEVQKERGMSAGFIGSKGNKFKEELPAQRLRGTDTRIRALDDHLVGLDSHVYGSTFQAELDKGRKLLGKIGEIRTRVDHLDIPAPEVIRYYTETITAFLNLIETLFNLAPNVELAAQVSAYVNLLHSKERAGQERATVTNALAADAFAPGMFRRFTQLISQQETFNQMFSTVATPAQTAFLREKMGAAEITEVERIRDIAFAKGLSGGFGVDPNHWFKTITKKIDLLKEVEDRLSTDLIERTARLHHDADRAYIVYLAIIVCTILSSIGLGLLFSRTILNQLGSEPGELTRIVNRVAQGDLTVLFNSAHAKVGSVYSAVGSMVGQLQRTVREVLLQSHSMAICAKELQEAKTNLHRDAQESRDQAEGVQTEMDQVAHNLAAIRTATTLVAWEIGIAADTSQQLSNNLAHIASGADGASNNVSSVASATEQISANTDSVQLSLEAVNASVGQVSSSVDLLENALTEVRERCTVAVQQSSQATNHATEAARVMSELATLAEQIGQVVDLINNIAEQTNLLAINATIEAAGAGDAGKGFAVVANEVKDLARQTSEATRMISEHIGNIQEKSNEATQATLASTRVIQEIDEAIGEIAASVEAQSRGIAAISHSMELVADAGQTVNRNMSELSDTTRSVANAVASAANAVDSISQLAAEAANAAGHLAERTVAIRKHSEESEQAVMQVVVSDDRIKSLLRQFTYIDGGIHHTATLIDTSAIPGQHLVRSVSALRVGEEPFSVENIKGAHLKWLGRLENVIRGRTVLAPEQVASGRECDFGKWYYSEGSERFGRLPVFQELGQVHLTVHETAREVVGLVQQGENHGAIEGMNRFNQIKDAMFVLLDQLYMEAGESRFTPGQ